MKNYNVLNELVSKTQELHRAIFDKGYEQGFKDGLNSGYNHDHEVLKAYGDGQDYILNKIREEIMDTGAYEQEVHGQTEFLRGIDYCLKTIDEYRESEVRNEGVHK